MMSKLTQRIKSEKKTVLKKVGICVDCGSIRTIQKDNKIKCKECTSIRFRE